MKTITFINEKGGIGKTSICYNVACELSKKKKIIMIDLDGQRANLTFFCGVKKPDDLITIYDLLHKGKKPDEAIINIQHNLDLIPASVDVIGITQAAKVSKLKQILKEIECNYDYCFFDLNPSPNRCHYLALSSCNYAIVPMLADVTSLESCNGIIESVNEVIDTSNPNLKTLGIVFNKFDGRPNMSRQVFELSNEIASRLNTRIFDTKIRNCVSIAECVAYHQSVTEYDSKSTVAEDIRNLTAEIENRIEEE